MIPLMVMVMPPGLNGFNYAYGNPINIVDPGGDNPIAYCLGLILIDGPLPIGDAVCLAIFAGLGLLALVPTINQDIDWDLINCNYPDIDIKEEWQTGSALTYEELMALSVEWQRGPEPDPEPEPDPYPPPPDIIIPLDNKDSCNSY